MLPAEQKTLWNKISEFPLNEPEAAVTFSDKLKEQQQWTISYTERVIEEYRKFIFLCMVAPKGASPSKAVDEAWHLHLTYTKSYWIDLCKNTLGREIHHHPSKGGTAENHKHKEWYKETLDLYKELFGKNAPADIWPDPSIIPEPGNMYPAASIAIAAGILLFPFLMIYVFYGEIFPYSLNGRQFLLFYPVFALCLLGANYALLWKKLKYYDKQVDIFFENNGTVFQKARFLYGKHRALQTGIVDLLRRNLLGVQRDDYFVVNKQNYQQQADEQNPLIKEYLRESNGYKLKYDLIDSHWYEDGKFTHPAFKKLHVFAAHKISFWQKYGLVIVVLTVGLARLLQGIANERPILMLVLEMIVLHVMVYYGARAAARSSDIFSRAKAVIEEQAENGQLHDDKIVNDFAVHGPSALHTLAEGAILFTLFSSYKEIKKASAFSKNEYGCSSCSGEGHGDCMGGACGGCGGD
jgi:hypothetical protein